MCNFQLFIKKSAKSLIVSQAVPTAMLFWADTTVVQLCVTVHSNLPSPVWWSKRYIHSYLASYCNCALKYFACWAATTPKIDLPLVTEIWDEPRMNYLDPPKKLINSEPMLLKVVLTETLAKVTLRQLRSIWRSRHPKWGYRWLWTGLAIRYQLSFQANVNCCPVSLIADIFFLQQLAKVMWTAENTKIFW